MNTLLLLLLAACDAAMASRDIIDKCLAAGNSPAACLNGE